MKDKTYKRLLVGLSFIIGLLSFSMTLTSCVDNDDDIPMNRYEAEKMTAAQALIQYKGRDISEKLFRTDCYIS